MDRKVSRAIWDYQMIQPGDRILIGLSGGKDSLALLHLLASRKNWRREDYHLIACHIKNSLDVAEGTAEKLAKVCKDLEVPLIALEGDPPTNLGGRKNLSPCFICARNRRKAMFQIAAQEGCQKLALGHHKNDIAQTLLMNLLWHGRHETMLPVQPMFDKSIIRPLALVEEKEISRLCRLGEFPVQSCRCAYGERSQRALAAQLIQQARAGGCKEAIDNLYRSVIPLATTQPN